MRTLSVSALKGKSHNIGLLPRQGTRPRKVYDLLHDSFGLPVNLSGVVPKGKLHHILEDLRNFYGCDIRMVKKCVYVLVGEWNGTSYRDYCLIRSQLQEEQQ